MASYNITDPDGKTYRITAPDGASEDEVMAYAQRSFKMAKSPESGGIMQGIGNLAAGAVRGAGSIGATLLAPVDAAARAVGVSNDFIGRTDRREQMDGALKGMGADPESWMYKGGKLGGEIAGTAGMGGLVARGASAVPYLAQNAAPLINAIASSGMTVGQTALTPAKVMALRAAGGGTVGAASAGFVDPGDAVFGGAVGAALPGALKVAGYAGGKVADGVGSMFLSKDAAMGRKVADIAGAKTRDEIEALRSLLNSPRPSNIGVNQTVPQILQNPAISQLQRSVQNAGNASVSEAVAKQNAAMLAALDRVSPVAGTVQDAAQDAGNAITRFAKDGEAAASKKVSSLYGAVDPFGETRINLPIEGMQAQLDKYLGPGTYGMGDSARKAVDVAKQISTDTLEGITAAKGAKELTLLDAVKRAGGINPNSMSSKQLMGEIKGLKEQGLGRVVSKSGQSIEKLAENMWQRGFIPDDDPVTLLNALRDGGGDVATGGGVNSMQAALERSMGDAPGAETIPKAITFEQLQNFRSSLVSDIEKLRGAPGNKSEYAALVAMKKQIDDAVDNVAGGGGAPGEFFPEDIAATWREAGAAHAAKKAQFNTGPQARLFRRGSDGLPAVQGGEVPRKFFNSLGSQTDDMAAFQNLARGDADVIGALKNYAVTSAANTKGRLDNLTNSAFNNWANRHSGAIGGLFDDSEQAVFSQIGKQLKSADAAQSLNIAVGSPTMQNVNAAMSNGLLENPVTSFVANRIPYIKNLAGPILDGLKQSAKKGKADTLGGLLADPEALDEALAKYLKLQSAGGLLNFMPNDQAVQLLYRSAPLLSSGQ